MSQAFERFAAYLKISDQLIEQASKEEVAEVARVLALHVAHYQTKHGAIPVEESLQLMLTETIGDDQAKALADAGMSRQLGAEFVACKPLRPAGNDRTCIRQ
jgi:hypothetical protein